MPSSPLNLNSAAPDATIAAGLWVIEVSGADESSTYEIGPEQLEVASEAVVAVALRTFVELSATLAVIPMAS